MKARRLPSCHGLVAWSSFVHDPAADDGFAAVMACRVCRGNPMSRSLARIGHSGRTGTRSQHPSCRTGKPSAADLRSAVLASRLPCIQRYCSGELLPPAGDLLPSTFSTSITLHAAPGRVPPIPVGEVDDTVTPSPRTAMKRRYSTSGACCIGHFVIAPVHNTPAPSVMHIPSI